MTRFPVFQSLFGLGAGIALFKGLKGIVSSYEDVADRLHLSLPRSVIKPTKVYTVTKKAIETVTVTANASPEHELNWPLVFDFILQQIDELDLRLLIAIVVFCVIGPVALYAVKGQKSVMTEIQSTQTDAPTEEDSCNTLKSDKPQPWLRHPYYQYNPAERAWLQFGKSKSESILFGYVPMSYQIKDFTPDGDQEVLRFSSTADAPQKGDEQDAAVGQASVEIIGTGSGEIPKKQGKARIAQNDGLVQPLGCQLQDLSDRDVSSFEESITINPFDKRIPSSKSSSSMPSSRSSPIATSVINNSHSHLRIQMTPTKTDTQLSSDLAYSQPFSY